MTTHSWPALTYERVPWHIAPEIEPHLDIWQKRRMERPYRAAVVPRIADLSPAAHLSRDTLELVERTSTLMLTFDAESATLPVAMPAVLLRSEAASSSQIEHLTSSARNVAVAELGLSSRENAQVVAANSRAMRQALALDDDLDAAAVLAVHRALLQDSAPEIAGRLRDRAVWIGASTLSPHDADYVAPRADAVPAALDDLCAFARRADVTGLLRAAVVHAQFETVHPFEDGNGRTGRALIHTVLRSAGLVTHATVPVSAGLLGNVQRYFDALTAYRDGHLDPLVTEVAHGARAAVANGRALAAQVVELRDRWRDTLTVRSDSTAWRLVDHLFTQPVVNAAHVASALGVSDRGARNAVDALEHAGVLTPVTVGRRNRVWQAPAILAAMDEFAARAQRRGVPG
ncbi:Fic family protein [Luteimicrobium subarcticum]|uniref:Fic family protein n=1 Tax=Luteimicrobium subarcticum TaxID=620910 RepID=A0A2M8W3P8_9MICO|nr:Fic family protein [Luteimicrobium subarcticum]PJI85548.1 Fic family protein [Luteimicrobium subarcticum]